MVRQSVLYPLFKQRFLLICALLSKVELGLSTFGPFVYADGKKLSKVSSKGGLVLSTRTR